ncbi:CPBP family intramembrane metalloprotease [Panacibacter ginsenosidivorans]|uniref:CPBP family intramembrane metalloprotease n=1 Tax=Panacibacter ginsenosidivorans TaxID=1813871 RepID=A0A5B8VF37_9BACT|nr:CPBP family intramembrane glutamic endopeptidase [Panacibacter ginsenosidivorans]QEC68938.1 CPBP family intramembrane metalloprotease [Panacibacter ginsenosidivorans]
MPDKLMRKDKIYISAYIFIYIIAALVLVVVFQNPVEDILTGLFSFGIGFSLVAWLLTKNISNSGIDKHPFKNEAWLLFALIFWIILYITYGSSFVDHLVPASILQNDRAYAFVILARKLLVFVMVPLLLYRLAGFSLTDFGLEAPIKNIFSKKSLITFCVISVIVLAFQYFMSNGGKHFREGNFSFAQMLAGFPLLFIWLFLEVGLVEEFFFRGLLQSRMSALLKSNAGGILISGLIFGLAHAPGLYLRGFGETEGITESLPFAFWAAYTVCTMSVGGIFIGIIWSKTKNLYLIMAIHAMLDIIPNFANFVHTWKL